MVPPTLPDIKLSYFDVTGRAESIRLVLFINDVPFNDERFKHEDWPKVKPTTPFGQAPTMTVNGKQYAQSGSLLRYVGRITGMHPMEPIKALPIEMVCDAFDDIMNAMGPFFHEHDHQKKMAFAEEFKKSTFMPLMSGIDKQIGQTNPKFCFGESLSIADLLAFNMVTWFRSGTLTGFGKNCTDCFVNLSRVCDTVGGHPKVVEWQSKHHS